MHVEQRGERAYTDRGERDIDGFSFLHHDHDHHHDDHSHDHHDDHSHGNDPHNKEFCVDVSRWGPVYYNPSQKECCKTTYEKECVEKATEICDKVTELRCELVPYQNCQLDWEWKNVTEYKSVADKVDIYDCQEKFKNITHIKKMPKCQEVTRLNCITRWVYKDGKESFEPTEDCEEVTWEECNLVPTPVNFTVPWMNCTAEPRPYETCVEEPTPIMIDVLNCKIEHAFDCKPIQVDKCKTFQYKHCEKVPKRECDTFDISQPKQDYHHLKQCLTDKTGTEQPNLTDLSKIRLADPIRINVAIRTDCVTHDRIRADGLKQNKDGSLVTASICPLNPDGTRAVHELLNLGQFSCENAAKRGFLEPGAAQTDPAELKKCQNTLKIANRARSLQDQPSVQIENTRCKVPYQQAIAYMKTGDLNPTTCIVNAGEDSARIGRNNFNLVERSSSSVGSAPLTPTSQ